MYIGKQIDTIETKNEKQKHKQKTKQKTSKGNIGCKRKKKVQKTQLNIKRNNEDQTKSD